MSLKCEAAHAGTNTHTHTLDPPTSQMSRILVWRAAACARLRANCVVSSDAFCFDAPDDCFEGSSCRRIANALSSIVTEESSRPKVNPTENSKGVYPNPDSSADHVGGTNITLS